MKNNRKALLIYPKFPEYSFWNFRYVNELFMLHSEFGEPKGHMPPLGLLSIAPVLAEKYGRENIRLIDLNNRKLENDQIEWADDVYISAMLTQRESFDEMAKLAKQYGKTVIAGGPYVTEDMANVDHIFINEADLVLKGFLDDLFLKKAKHVYVSPRKPNENEFLRPDFSYINVHNYTTMGVQFSRGCPHDCEFCDITIRYGRKMRTKEVDHVLEELNQLYDLGWRAQVFFIDDNFIGKPSDAHALLQEVTTWQKEKNYPFDFITQASVLLAEKNYEPLLLDFYPAGFSMIFLGIETVNEDSLRETGKASNLKKGSTMTEKITRIQEVGKVMVFGGMILGFDSDEKDIFDRQVQFIKDIKLPIPMIGLLNPLPDTKLRERLHNEKRLKEGPVGDVAGATLVGFQPKKMTERELIDGYKKVLNDLFIDLQGFYNRCKDCLEVIAPKQGKIPLNREGFKGIFSILFQQGIRSKGRKYFWRYLFNTMFRYPAKIEYIFRFAGYAQHYNRLAAKLIADESDFKY